MHIRFSVFSFGGGPAVNHLYMCAICQVEIEALAKRRKTEIDTFIKVFVCFSEIPHLVLIFFILLSVFGTFH